MEKQQQDPAAAPAALVEENALLDLFHILRQVKNLSHLGQILEEYSLDTHAASQEQWNGRFVVSDSYWDVDERFPKSSTGRVSVSDRRQQQQPSDLLFYGDGSSYRSAIEDQRENTRSEFAKLYKYGNSVGDPGTYGAAFLFYDMSGLPRGVDLLPAVVPVIVKVSGYNRAYIAETEIHSVIKRDIVEARLCPNFAVLHDWFVLGPFIPRDDSNDNDDAADDGDDAGATRSSKRLQQKQKKQTKKRTRSAKETEQLIKRSVVLPAASVWEPVVKYVRRSLSLYDAPTKPVVTTETLARYPGIGFISLEYAELGTFLSAQYDYASNNAKNFANLRGPKATPGGILVVPGSSSSATATQSRVRGSSSSSNFYEEVLYPAYLDAQRHQKDGKLTETMGKARVQCLSVVFQLLSAVASMHAQGIQHRDIASVNVVVTEGKQRAKYHPTQFTYPPVYSVDQRRYVLRSPDEQFVHMSRQQQQTSSSNNNLPVSDVPFYVPLMIDYSLSKQFQRLLVDPPSQSETPNPDRLKYTATRLFYRAPELLLFDVEDANEQEGVAFYDASDVFSIGSVIMEMLLGTNLLSNLSDPPQELVEVFVKGCRGTSSSSSTQKRSQGQFVKDGKFSKNFLCVDDSFNVAAYVWNLFLLQGVPTKDEAPVLYKSSRVFQEFVRVYENTERSTPLLITRPRELLQPMLKYVQQVIGYSTYLEVFSMLSWNPEARPVPYQLLANSNLFSIFLEPTATGSKRDRKRDWRILPPKAPSLEISARILNSVTLQREQQTIANQFLDCLQLCNQCYSRAQQFVCSKCNNHCLCEEEDCFYKHLEEGCTPSC